jgi:hypothetical protein
MMSSGLSCRIVLFSALSTFVVLKLSIGPAQSSTDPWTEAQTVKPDDLAEKLADEGQRRPYYVGFQRPRRRTQRARNFTAAVAARKAWYN